MRNKPKKKFSKKDIMKWLIDNGHCKKDEKIKGFICKMPDYVDDKIIKDKKK